MLVLAISTLFTHILLLERARQLIKPTVAVGTQQQPARKKKTKVGNTCSIGIWPPAVHKHLQACLFNNGRGLGRQIGWTTHVCLYICSTFFLCPRPLAIMGRYPILFLRAYQHPLPPCVPPALPLPPSPLPRLPPLVPPPPPLSHQISQHPKV